MPVMPRNRAGISKMARTKFAEVVSLAPEIAEGHEALGTMLVELNKPARRFRSWRKRSAT